MQEYTLSKSPLLHDSDFYGLIKDWAEARRLELVQIREAVQRIEGSPTPSHWEALYQVLSLFPPLPQRDAATFCTYSAKKVDDSPTGSLGSLSGWMAQCENRYEALVKGIHVMEADYQSYMVLKRRNIPGSIGYLGTSWINLFVAITGDTHWRTISPIDFDAITTAFRQIIHTRNGPQFYWKRSIIDERKEILKNDLRM